MTSVRSTLSDIFRERTSFDFVGRPRRWVILSGSVILIGLISLGTRGLVFGLDFEGGTAWQVQSSANLSVAGVRDALKGTGLDSAKVQILGGNNARVQFQHVEQAQQDKVRAALAKYASVKTADVSITDVGPTWGGEVSRKAGRALFFFIIGIAAYLSWRFEWKMAMAALAAVVHDILVTVGVYSLSGFEVSPATVIAFLTILGFSLYDTVVVFDKVDENISRIGSIGGGKTYSDVVNLSLNQVLMRSLNTSFVALLPVASMLTIGAYVLHALVIRDFALALFIGLLTGAYSSIFVATPVLAWWKEREPRYASMRQRVGARSMRPATATASQGMGFPDPGEQGQQGKKASGPVGTVPSATLTDEVETLPVERPSLGRPSLGSGQGSVTPRPRKKRKKK